MIKKLLVSVLLTVLSVPAFAVTEKEMEQARAIAAQAYLRYANDGSGYLDEFKASSMSELESKLKAKEKENLKAFKSVKVPGDYASWDKAKLLEFWGTTFFTSPNLAEKGKGARTRVRQRISAMTVGAVEDAPKETPKEVIPEPDASEAAAAEVAAQADTAMQAETKQEDILADQNAIAQDNEERQYKQEDSGTWIYVLVLVVLIGVVIWLVVFAANMMKKQSEPLEKMKTADPDGNGAAAARENSELRKQYSIVKSQLDEYKSAFEDSQAENKRLNAELKALRAEVSSLRASSAAAARTRQENPDDYRPRRQRVETEDEAPRRQSASVLYLGRVNSRGLFIRADRRFNPGNSIYRLETRDGLVGTFQVVDAPEVSDLALDNPVEYLSGGCTAIDIEDTAGADRIVTENAGTAMFESGAWKVLRKSRIRYE